MRHVRMPGKAILEYSGRDREIQIDLKHLLNILARAHCFNWTAPTPDIVRRLMNEVHEFKPQPEDQP